MTDGYLKQVTWARAKNDELRTRLNCAVIVSDDIRELGDTVVAQALLMMAERTRFNDADHSAGWFHFCSRTFRWSIVRTDGVRELHLSL